MNVLSIRAGKQAIQLIQDSGLNIADIGSVFGASGAAKWLTISALDAAIFGDWLVQAPQPIHLFGTSIGAWKLAVAAQDKPKQSLEKFAQAYCHQHYPKHITHADVQTETDRIINKVFTPDKIQQTLNNSHFNFHCGAVVCHGLLARESKPALALAMGQANLLNFVNRKLLKTLVSRVVFFDKRNPPPLKITDTIPTLGYPLSEHNFIKAVTASGSIPYVMAGVNTIPGAEPGMYRDGGLIDYHPLPINIWREDKLILYPHFYSHIVPGWFDKPLPWRKAKARQLDNVVLISPSAEFVDSLPAKRIPDRQDFIRFKGDNEARIAQWQYCIDRGKELADAFMECVNSRAQLRKTVQQL